MDMEQSLMPFVLLAPPVPAQQHHAPASPTEADLEVSSEPADPLSWVWELT